ncbi:helix-turn-helix domain-containing protein [Actinokineospora sp. 24-640]
MDALLAVHRKRAGLTQEQLSARAGVSVRAISDVEGGRVRRPQRRTVDALVSGLALDEDERAAFRAAARLPAEGVLPPAPLAPAPLSGLEPPVAITDFVDRDAELSVLSSLAGTSGAPVAVVHGVPGAGKTTLAVRACALLSSRFPDGVAFVDLRGSGPDPLPPSVAARALVSAVQDMSVKDSPHSIDEVFEIYRSVFADKQILLVLDDAFDEDQVRPLLPDVTNCLVVVTARRTLTRMDPVARVRVGPLSDDAAVRLFAGIVGATRAAADPDATAEVAARCGNHPLSLRVAGNRLATRPRRAVAHLLSQLRDDTRRRTTLTAGDLRVADEFAHYFRTLSPAARALLHALASNPVVDPRHPAVPELADASLIDPAPDGGHSVPPIVLAVVRALPELL